VGRHLTRWLIPLPAIILSFWPTVVRADIQPGLQTTYYSIDEIPPVKSTTEYPVCGTEIENNINRNYDYELFEDCTYDLFMVHMTGFIDIPEHQTIQVMIASDDGGTIKIGTEEFGVWWDQGCTWTESGYLELDAGSQPLDLWMYENGNGTCLMLAWNIDDQGWEMVPDSAFTQQAVASTTTSTTTSLPPTSTTLEETTTTSSTSSSTTSTSTTILPTSTTTVQSSTTTSVADTTTTTTTTVAPAPTTTQAPYTPPQTTTTALVVAPSTTVESTTTTTSLPEPVTTVEETSTTTYLPVPDPTLPVSVPTLPVETTPPTTQPLPQTSTPQTTTPEVVSSSTTTIPEPGQPISDTKVAEILTELKDAAPAQIVAAINQVLASNITSDQAVSIASSPEMLAAVTEQQAEAIFEQIVVEELTVEQAEELVAVLNEAPTKVKKAFQETINVFAGVFDSFQMVGQTIPVGERRTLVAVSNTLVAVGASLRRRENK
jgi:hypothetical protein